ncbi:leucine-rich repeat extensin-like protein 1 [Olea europaea var. sylvestris]|uniref:leucine-rich repeat extensin-like protein 1 n=1 Tax=Olea europaea var. sylvestris TaxID=158386 RepID=UPI000C1D288F|nr:leucine-rich repeat extensin-like protein 1 [Olea europaea var. sylvestris]
MDYLHLFLLTLVFSSLCDFSQEMSTVTAIEKDRVSCKMCSSCDDPCQPIFSPPPPPSSVLNCAPPPSPPNGVGGGGVYYYSPPPPANPSYYPPTDPYGYTTPPPPNPILPYFPFYYYNPPPASHSDSKSVQLKTHSTVSSLVVILSLLLFL